MYLTPGVSEDLVGQCEERLILQQPRQKAKQFSCWLPRLRAAGASKSLLIGVCVCVCVCNQSRLDHSNVSVNDKNPSSSFLLTLIQSISLLSSMATSGGEAATASSRAAMATEYRSASGGWEFVPYLSSV